MRRVLVSGRLGAGILSKRALRDGSRVGARGLAVAVAAQQQSREHNPPRLGLAAVSLAAAVVWTALQSADCDSGKPKPRTSAPPLSRNFVADVVEAVSPTVVNIAVSGYLVGSGGSGFIIRSDGFIVTNAHVVDGGHEAHVVVTLSNGRKLPATIHAMDSLSDIAVLKVDTGTGAPLPVAPLGRSASVRSGEFVVAIGSPMMLQNSASLGIISATARHASELGLSNNRSEYLQTDAAVNVGNSGGPLVNVDGEVIGINTLKVRGTDGISLAIPIDIASQIVNQLIQHRRVTRPYVGLKMAEVVTDPRRAAAAAGRGGALEEARVTVLEVQPRSPAAAAGLASGDVIVGVFDRDVRSVRDVLDAIGLEVGRQLRLRIKRGEYELTVTLVTAPEISKR